MILEAGKWTWTSILFPSSVMSLRVEGAVQSVGNALRTKVLCHVARVKPAVSRWANEPPGWEAFPPPCHHQVWNGLFEGGTESSWSSEQASGRTPSAFPRWASCAACSLCTYLSWVLVNVNVNDSTVFVALLDDIILDLVRPAGIIFSEKQGLYFHLKPLLVRFRKMSF